MSAYEKLLTYLKDSGDRLAVGSVSVLDESVPLMVVYYPEGPIPYGWATEAFDGERTLRGFEYNFGSLRESIEYIARRCGNELLRDALAESDAVLTGSEVDAIMADFRDPVAA